MAVNINIGVAGTQEIPESGSKLRQRLLATLMVVIIALLAYSIAMTSLDPVP